MSVTPIEPSARTDRRMFRRVLTVGFTGTLIEWYDFVIFGTIAVLYFGDLFYPVETPFLSVLASLGTFAVGFAARPVGGLFFGYLGDRIGRRPVLVATLSIMGVSTLLIGLLPTYEQIGAWAPFFLVLLRLAQGFSLGGEWGGVSTLLIEHSPRERRAEAGSWGQLGGFVGPLLGTLLIAFITSTLDEGQMESWGWRVPFLVSVLLVGVSFYIRRAVSESPSFRLVESEKQVEKAPVRTVLRRYPRSILAVFLMHGGQTVFFYTCLTFSVSYMTTQTNISETNVLLVNAVFLLAAGVTCLLCGRAADRIGRKPIYLSGSIAAIIVAFPLFWLYGSGSMLIIIPTAIVLGVVEGFLYAIQPAYYGELFPTKFRYAGMSFGYQAATVAVGATAPLLGVLMLEWTGGSTWLFSSYMVAILILCVIGVLIAGETIGTDIDDVPEEKASERVPIGD